MSRWHEYDIADVALEFGTDTSRGKDNTKKRKGTNTVFMLPIADAKSALKQLSSDASFMLLVVTYVLSAFMGRLSESIAGILFIIAVFLISFSIKYSSSKRISNSYRLLLPVSKVVANGSVTRLSVFDVEVGDLITFSHGDIIPADARLVSSGNLVVAERRINPDSGRIEYSRVDKDHNLVYHANEIQSSYKNVVYAGSMVVSGKGSAIVTEIGEATRLSAAHSGITVVSSNDAPSYLQSFYKSTKRISLCAFLAVVPITLLALATQSLRIVSTNSIDLLYLFMLMLSLSATCMSEMVISPAETLVTKEILLSSRSRKAKSNTESRITKLAASETLADTDTILILSPEVIIDTRDMVRRVSFGDKQYRFDALRSDELAYFYTQIEPIFKFTHNNNLSSEIRIIKEFISQVDVPSDSRVFSENPRFLRNYPLKDSRACVFETDHQGVPVHYIAHTSDVSVLEKCSYLRTEGGGLWKIDQKTFSHIIDQYGNFVECGLSVQIYFSSSIETNALVFEGMVAVGREFPFANGELSEEFSVSGVQPVLVLDDENEENFTIALQCGLIDDADEIAVASDYKRNGMSILDAPINTRAYIGFGCEAVADIVERFQRNGGVVLPIIKDSTDRKSISPISVYATHVMDSYDSVRISSSLSLKPADSVEYDGGLFDALKMIRGSSMARLKLGIYKNYLAFAMFLRIIAVCVPLLLGNSSMVMTTLMILLSGFACDGAALFSLLSYKGIPVKPQNAASEAKTLFSPALFLFFAFSGIVSASVVLITTGILLSVGILAAASTSLFLMYCMIACQISALGGFLIILNKRSKRGTINWCYLIILLVVSSIIFIQSRLPSSFYNISANIGLSVINLNLLPYIFVTAVVSLAIVLLISKLLSVFLTLKIK